LRTAVKPEVVEVRRAVKAPLKAAPENNCKSATPAVIQASLHVKVMSQLKDGVEEPNI